MSAIFYVLRTGCQWNALPRSLGASRTGHDRFQEWRKAGVFKRMWIDGLSVYDKKTGIDWKWQAMDGVITKAPLGGKKHRTKSHRQSKSGTKRSILVDGKGVPLGVCVDGVNRHDMKMTKATLQSIVIYRPEPTIRSKRAHVHGQRLRVSRGIRITGRVWLYNSHQIKRKGKKAALKKEYQNTELDDGLLKEPILG